MRREKASRVKAAPRISWPGEDSYFPQEQAIDGEADQTD